MKTPIALWLADKLEDPTNTHGYDLVKGGAAAELIRQHEVIEQALAALMQISNLRNLGKIEPEVVAFAAITTIQEQLK